jgi:hypothetical protein
MKYVNYGDRKKVASMLKPIYTAATESEALTALDELRAEFGKTAPGVIAAWERAWEQFIPFLAFDREIRRVIYTTNAIWVLYFCHRSGSSYPARRSKRVRPDSECDWHPTGSPWIRSVGRARERGPRVPGLKRACPTQPRSADTARPALPP